MAQTTVITITHGSEAAATITGIFTKTTTDPRKQATSIANFFRAVSAGDKNAKFDTQVNGGSAVAAHGTVTFSSLADADTVTVGTQTFTAKTSGASGANQFNLGASDTEAATNFAAAVNAHASLVNVVTASPAAAITTITAAVKGLIGNQIGIAISAHGSVSAAKLASGAEPAANVYKCGVS